MQRSPPSTGARQFEVPLTHSWIVRQFGLERSRRHGAHIVFSVPSVLPSVGPAARLGMLVPEWGFLVQYLFDHILLDRAANDLRHKLNESHIPKIRLDS